MPFQYQLFTSSDTFTVPDDVTTIGIRAWGKGGTGTNGTGTTGGAGGGGGGYSATESSPAPSLSVTPGDTFTVTIGSGSAKAVNSTLTTIVEAGDASGATGGAGVTGTVKKTGGNGGTGSPGPGSAGGGGGGSAPTEEDSGAAGTAGNTLGTGGAGAAGNQDSVLFQAFGTGTWGYGGNGATDSLPTVGGNYGGGGGGGSSTHNTGTAGGPAAVVFYWLTPDPPPPPPFTPESTIGPCVVGVPSPPPFPGAVIVARSTFGAPPPPPPPDVPNVGLRMPVLTPSPPPFPGFVLQVVNQFGQPVPAVASGQLSQAHVEIPFPPPFAGSVTTFSNRPPVQPPVISPTIPRYTVDAGDPPRFPGAVIVGAATRYGLAAIGVPTPRVVAMPFPPPPYAGDVVTRLTRVTPVRSAPSLVVDAPSPPLFPGMVLTNSPRKPQELRGSAAVVSTPSPPPYAGEVIATHPIGQAIRTAARSQTTVAQYPISPPEPGGVTFRTHRAEVPLQPPLMPPIPVAQTPSPPPYAGESLFIRRDGQGVSTPVRTQAAVVHLPVSPPEPGGTILSAGRTAAPAPTKPANIGISQLERPAELHQPIFWSGVHERPAVRPQPVVVQIPSPPPFAGYVTGFPKITGLIPPRQAALIVMQMPSPPSFAGDAITRIVSASMPAAPSRPAIVAAMPSLAFAGEVQFIARRPPTGFGSTRPTIIGPDIQTPATILQPFFGWGYRTGSGTPPEPLSGCSVFLIGKDRSVVTLTSFDC